MPQQSFTVRTHARAFEDVTAQVDTIVRATGVETGVCSVFLRHTSASLLICENADAAVRRDLERFMRRVAPDGAAEYEHDTEGPDDTHGIYARAILNLEPAFLVGRYETILADSTILDRRFTAGGGVEVFPQGEVRAVYEQSFDSDARMVLLQLVGGSTFQPTGLRR